MVLLLSLYITIKANAMSTCMLIYGEYTIVIVFLFYNCIMNSMKLFSWNASFIVNIANFFYATIPIVYFLIQFCYNTKNV